MINSTYKQCSDIKKMVENALLNRHVFSCFVKELRESVARMASGRLFQRRGAALENAAPPKQPHRTVPRDTAF